MTEDLFPIGELPSNWDLVPFEECCAKVSDSRDASEYSGMPYLGLEHLESNFPALVGKGQGADVVSAKTDFRRNDVLFGKLRPYLRKGLRVDFDGVCSTDIFVFRAKKGTRPEYLGYLIHADPFARQAIRTTSGVNHPRTSWDGLRRFKVPRPPEAEQLQIAAVLSAVQRAIELQERLVILTEELKAALMRNLFAKGARGEPVRQTEVGLMPQSWKPTPLGACCDILNSSMSYRDFLLAPDYTGADAVRCMAVKVSDMNLGENAEAFETANALRYFPPEVAKKKLVPPGAVVFPKRGAAIATNKKRQTTTWTALDPNLIAVRAKAEVDPRFLFYWSQTFDLRKITDPGPTPQLNKKDLVPVKMPLPPTLEEQQIVAQTLGSVNDELAVHRNAHSTMSQLFRTILHQLMTGQVSVHDLDLSALNDSAVAAEGDS